MFVWLTIVTAALLLPMSTIAESALSLKIMDYTISFDDEKLRQFTECVSDPGNNICNVNISPCLRLFTCGSRHVYTSSVGSSSTKDYFNVHNCSLLLSSLFFIEMASSIRCTRMQHFTDTNYSIYLSAPCKSFSLMSNLSHDLECSGLIWSISQKFEVVEIHKSAESLVKCGLCENLNRKSSKSGTDLDMESNHVNVIVSVVIVILSVIVVVIVFLCWRRNLKRQNCQDIRTIKSVETKPTNECHTRKREGLLNDMIHEHGTGNQESPKERYHLPPEADILPKRAGVKQTNRPPVGDNDRSRASTTSEHVYALASSDKPDADNVYSALHGGAVVFTNTYDVLLTSDGYELQMASPSNSTSDH